MWFQVYLTSTAGSSPALAGWNRMDRELQSLLAENPDPYTLAKVHDSLYPVVYRYVHFRLADEEVCEDICSEVFLRLMSTLKDHHRPINNLKGWLLGTASHLINDHLRMSYSRPVEALQEYHPVADPSPEEAAENAWQQSRVRAALMKLTSDQQHVIALRFSEEYSLEETARLMDRTVGAVKTLQYRALAALRQILGEK